MSYNFPTLGELVKFAFDAAGVLPRKHGEADGLSLSDKKRIQKQLERLIDEEGSLTKRCAELICTLNDLVASAVYSEKVGFVFCECVTDIFESYRAVIVEDGTFLNKKDSILWFGRAHAVSRLVLSIQKHVLRFNLSAVGFSCPEENDWFLPEIDGDAITWPLAKAMSWVYAVCNISRTHFHYPGKSATTDSPEQQQNLDNASAWLNGKRIPSWSGLHWNFSRSLHNLKISNNPAYQRDITGKLYQSVFQVLFLARVSTYVCSLVKENYGIGVLRQLLCQFKQERALLSAEVEGFVSVTTTYLNKKSFAPAMADLIWMHDSERYWMWLRDKMIALGRDFEYLLRLHDYGSLPEDVVMRLIKIHGEYGVRSELERLEVRKEFHMPAGFPQGMYDGFDLKGKIDCSDEDIDQYVLKLQDDNIESCLGWMEPWLRAVVRYRKEEYESAFHYIEMAFEMARYSAGRNQYALVNHFVELSAKTDRWKSFKKGVGWAQFLGFPIRWLRDQEPTEEALRDVFALMKKVKYSHM